MFRKLWNQALPEGTTLQRQAYDHVLRKAECEHKAFAKVAEYILANPIRAGLLGDASQWPFAGCLVPGYPSLDPHASDYWNSFWLAHQTLLEP
ncbi:MAG: hypothetical protein WEB60_14550 [Terrimicrobiaceae bacterium]